MSARVYVLLGVIKGKADQVALRDKAGVRMVNMLESPPEVIMAVEASERQGQRRHSARL